MNNRDELISIVVPVYNVEKYLKRCLDSLINQTYENIEIILVNDGSTDDSLEICKEYSKNDKRIKIVSKKNEGLGMARNTGIDNASGQYICFFDSDDFVEINAIEKLHDVIIKERPQIVCFGFKKLRSNGEIINTYIPDANKMNFCGEEVINEFLPELISENPNTGRSWGLTMSAWASIYSMDLVKDSGWRFVSERDIISEDIYSLLLLYKNVNKVSILSEALYFYCINPSSLTHTYRKDRYEKIEYFYRMCQTVCKELQYPEFIKRRIIYPYLGNTIDALKQIIGSNEKFKDKLINLKKIVKDKTLQEVLITSKNNKWNFSKKILFLAIRYKMTFFTYLLLLLKQKV